MPWGTQRPKCFACQVCLSIMPARCEWHPQQSWQDATGVNMIVGYLHQLHLCKDVRHQIMKSLLIFVTKKVWSPCCRVEKWRPVYLEPLLNIEQTSFSQLMHCGHRGIKVPLTTFAFKLWVYIRSWTRWRGYIIHLAWRQWLLWDSTLWSTSAFLIRTWAWSL